MDRYLQDNELSGTIPSCIGDIASLTTVLVTV